MTFSDFAAMRWTSAVGEDNVLMRFDRDGALSLTDMFYEIEQAATDHRASLIVIDTAVDTFGGNENDRSQVR